MRGESVERFAGDFVVGEADLVELGLGLFVDDADAGAGGEVVEAVEGDLLPGGGELGRGIGLALMAILPGSGVGKV